MSINLSVPQQQDADLSPRITIIGVGGAGGNAVNNMIESRLEGVEFLVANTDAQALTHNLAERRIQLGPNITHGLGAGARPDIGRAAAEEAIDDLVSHLQGAHMVFITAGMGGGTGTGAAPVIARLAREHGILTVGVVTKPFQFEGINRMRLAEAGIEEMQQYVDTLIVIPNQNLFRIANEKTTFADAFSMADEVLHSGVRGVTDLMVVPGLINLDFADIRTVMSEMGKAMMGTGESEGDDRARLAAEAAISNPLLDEVSMRGARGVLINITGGPDMTLFEVDEAANRIGDEVDSDANIIFGSTMNPELEGKMRVSVVATGIDADAAAAPKPILKVYTSTGEQKPVDAEEKTESPQDDDAQELPAVAMASGPAAFDAADSATAPVFPPAPPRLNDVTGSETPREKEPAIPATAEFNSESRLDSKPNADLIDATLDVPEPETAAKTEAAAFMPPQPVDPGRRIETTVAPDPFREADLLNAGPVAKDRDRRLMPSLFQRVADNVRSKTAPSPLPTGKAENSVNFGEPREHKEPVLTQRPASKPATENPDQARLDTVAKPEPLAVSQSEDDLLDIPAFLRRQAN